MDIFYNRTNENLDSIVAGLDLTEQDIVLAVGGSGDQAFAMLEFAGRVKVVDKNQEQVQYIKRRAEALRQGDDVSFRQNTHGAYFYDERLDRIKDKLQHLAVAEPADIVELTQREENYSRLYLSNAIGHLNSHMKRSDVTKILHAVAQKLTLGGLIYVANHLELVDISREHDSSYATREFLPYEDLSISSFLPTELILSLSLSQIARERDDCKWNPAVYRKVNNFKILSNSFAL